MISWSRISAAILFYQTRGYQYIDVPWAVSREICEMTHSGENWEVSVQHRPGFSNWNGVLVGSGEQGLLALAKHKQIDPGMWMTATPCFRVEPPLTLREGITQEQFFKVELMILQPRHPAASIESCLISARRFMESQGALHRTKVVQTTEGFDLEMDGVEVGSYGHRVVGDLSWVYGTGLAEPRFSTILKGKSATK